jgi:hypothetical protein
MVSLSFKGRTGASQVQKQNKKQETRKRLSDEVIRSKGYDGWSWDDSFKEL